MNTGDIYAVPSRGGAMNIDTANEVFPKGINIHFETDLSALQRHGPELVYNFDKQVKVCAGNQVRLINTGPVSLTVGDDIALVPLLYAVPGDWVRRKTKMVLQTVQKDVYARDLQELLQMVRAFHDMYAVAHRISLATALSNEYLAGYWTQTKAALPNLGGDRPQTGGNKLWVNVVDAIMRKQNYMELTPLILQRVYGIFVEEMIKYSPVLAGIKSDMQSSHMIPTKEEMQRVARAVTAVYNADQDGRVAAVPDMRTLVEGLKAVQKTLRDFDVYRVKRFGRIISAPNRSIIPVCEPFVLHIVNEPPS